MHTAVHHHKPSIKTSDVPVRSLSDFIKESFQTIAPFWPLKNLIAVNPLQGLEHLPIEEALTSGAVFFQRASIPAPMEAINRITIKWMQALCDDGHATIPMPLKHQGMYAAWHAMARYDTQLHGNDPRVIQWLTSLPAEAEDAIAVCIQQLRIPTEDQTMFLTLLLTTLSGWSAYVAYRTQWAGMDAQHLNPMTQTDYLALRIIITTLVWKNAGDLLEWHRNAPITPQADLMQRMEDAEQAYRMPLLQSLAAQPIATPHTPDAQFVLCIDVRSEQFRKVLESQGDYQTFGFAGFFGIPVQIKDGVTGESYASCPVLLAPKHEVVESPCSHHACTQDHHGYERISAFKRMYQSVKYTFTAPFALVEGLGMMSGVWMGLRSLAPRLASQLATDITQAIRPPHAVVPSLENIPFKDQCAYAEGALRMIGLTDHIAPYVVLCGHGSSTQNNAYATALDCGACGGRHGASNARILAAILNQPSIHAELATRGIHIPATTRFIAAEHNTTTDAVEIYDDSDDAALQKVRKDLLKARHENSALRLIAMDTPHGTQRDTWLRAQDWAQTRPEWGLARNAAFIVAPRDLTSSLALEGRCFLHSYDYGSDADGSLLTTILTAPMVVAQWINSQYLFSTVDNVAYGGGSKITQNITGKIGVMQGNASDLMTGLPLQSVYADDATPYHEPQRLMCVVYAPRLMLHRIVQAQPVLQKLFGNGWVQLACIEPESRELFMLQRDGGWKMTH